MRETGVRIVTAAVQKMEGRDYAGLLIYVVMTARTGEGSPGTSGGGRLQR